MRAKVVLVALLATAIATTTVSAAMLPASPLAADAGGPDWEALHVRHIDFSEGVSVAAAGIYVLKTQEEYVAFQQSVAYQKGAFPFVDFAESFVVVASAGVLDLGNDLTVTQARATSGHVVVGLDRQFDNPNHCRVTHDEEPVGEVAVIARPVSDPAPDLTVGFETYESVMPYDSWYNCHCPEM